jgi:hypothetical protein
MTGIKYDDGIGLRPVSKSEDPQYAVDQEYYCCCGCEMSSHKQNAWDCSACGDCEEYTQDDNNPVEPAEPDWDAMPGGHDYE